jgi:hypothetical protein
MAHIPPEEERFAKNTTIMIQAVHESISHVYNKGYKTVDPSLIAVAASIISAFDKHYLIQGFIENSAVNFVAHETSEAQASFEKKYLTCWDSIKARDQEFFVQNASDVFKYLPMDKVNLFKDLFTTKDDSGNFVVPESLKDQIWKLFDAMIKISIKYIHKNRSPLSYVDSDGTVVNTYNSSFFDEVDLQRHAQVWEVVLDFPPNY